MLDAPVNPTMGHPPTHIRQLCAIWLVETWEQVPEALIKKAWKVVNYAKFEDAESSIFIVEHTQNSVVREILESSNREAVDTFLCEDNVCSDDEFVDRNLFV